MEYQEIIVKLRRVSAFLDRLMPIVFITLPLLAVFWFLNGEVWIGLADLVFAALAYMMWTTRKPVERHSGLQHETE